eukprot:scaffold114812_cov36-Phaeocystis_antarctica.AAC.1
MGALAAVMSAVSSASEAARPISASTSKTAPYHTVYMLGSRCGIAPHLTHFHPVPPGPSPEELWEQLWEAPPLSSVAAALELLELLGGMLATRPVHFHSVRSRQLMATLSAKEGRSAECILLMSSKGSAMMAWVGLGLWLGLGVGVRVGVGVGVRCWGLGLGVGHDGLGGNTQDVGLGVGLGPGLGVGLGVTMAAIALRWPGR